jgi:hypothetical protein
VVVEKDCEEEGDYGEEELEHERLIWSSHSYLGRSWRDAYEIDDDAYIESRRPLKLYQRVTGRVLSSGPYDLLVGVE